MKPSHIGMPRAMVTVGLESIAPSADVASVVKVSTQQEIGES